MNSVAFYTLVGVCLSAHLLLCVESLPLRMSTTTESPPVSPTPSSAPVTEASAAEPASENPNRVVVTWSGHEELASFLSYMYDILTELRQQPTPRPDSEQPRADSNLAVSSTAVMSSSSTTGLSEENCSSRAIQPGPCRKRSASTDELAKEVFLHMMGWENVKRAKEENPPASTSNLPTPTASTSNLPTPNLEELPVGETSSHSTDSHQQQRDSGSSSSSDSDESTSSSSVSPLTSTQPTTRKM